MLITSFSDFRMSLEEYPKSLKGKKLHTWILKQLKHRTRVSCFEISSDQRMARTITYLNGIGKIKLGNKDHHYPYTGITVR